jgi:hypothetical protein
MKYLERFKIKTQKDIYLGKYDIKKYIVSKFDTDYFLDEILEFGYERIDIKTMYVFDSNDNFKSSNAGRDNFEYFELENVLFSSDDYNEAKKYFDNIIEMYNDTNKYNL